LHDACEQFNEFAAHFFNDAALADKNSKPVIDLLLLGDLVEQVQKMWRQHVSPGLLEPSSELRTVHVANSLSVMRRIFHEFCLSMIIDFVCVSRRINLVN